MERLLWHNGEFERIKYQIRTLDFVLEVKPYGSFGDNNHDEASDLDIFVRVTTLPDFGLIETLFEDEEILGQERYQGEGVSLFRVLLTNGRSYDIKVALDGSAHNSSKHVPLPGTDEFWFALHAAHHALIRGRTMITFDLLISGFQQVMSRYWEQTSNTQLEIEKALNPISLEFNTVSLLRNIKLLAELAGVAYNDRERSVKFVNVIQSLDF